jgi:hypothetical protein
VPGIYSFTLGDGGMGGCLGLRIGQARPISKGEAEAINRENQDHERHPQPLPGQSGDQWSGA